MKRFWILTKGLFLIHIRNRMVLFWNMVFPVFLLVIYSLIFGSMQVDGQSYLSWVIPGVVVLNILAFGLMASSTTLVNMRETRVLLHLSTTPVPARELVGAFILINVLIAFIQSGLILVAAVFIIDYSISLEGLLRAVPMILLAILTSVALGQIISGVASKVAVAAALGQLFYFSQMFITDMVIPVNQMPEWLQNIVRYFPGYAITQLVRPPLLTGEWGAGAWMPLLLVAFYVLAGAAVSALLFRWAPKN